jgi:hypothetical protein
VRAVIRSLHVDAWTFIWLMVFLKIPIVALFVLVRWAIRAPDVEAPDEDGGIGPPLRPVHPYHPRSRLPRSPRRGPHGSPASASPPRVRVAASRQRLPRG